MFINTHQLSSQIKDEPINIVCAADNSYAMPLTVTVRSALENLKSNYKIFLFILDGGIKEDNKQRIIKSLSSEKCEIRFLPIYDDLVRDIDELHEYLKAEGDRKVTSQLDHISIASYYRFIIPEVMPEKCEKVIYLDCDLVVKGDLGQLWQTDLGDNYVLAAQDMGILYVSTENGLLNYKDLGISPDTKYFNAGVLVINLKKWRTEGITTKAIKYFKQYKDSVRWGDQDVLNAVFAGQWSELDPRWNFQHTIYAFSSYKESPFSEDIYNTLIHDPYIIHFVTELKPWNSRHAKLKEYFFHYVDMTAWSGWRLTFWRRVWITSRREFRKSIRRINK
jgi:lipopolysaccharide biosynthesis glycosyltransferase